jgi:hypothetical protein
MDHKLEASQHPITKVFSPDYHFEIPPYQRPYAWELEQVEQLVDDLLQWSQEQAGRREEDKSPYFLGSIVLIRGAGLHSAYQVVDGQQRLTTLSLLFAAASQRLAKGKEQLEKRIREKGDLFDGTEDRYRLLPRERDCAFYTSKIMGPAGIDTTLDPVKMTESQRRLWSNACHLLHRLQALDEADATRLIQDLLRHCYLVVVSTSDFASAYRIFSVLNDRGLDLSPTDILKARIIEGVPESQRDRYTRLWEDTEEEIGRVKFLELFSHIRMVQQKAKLRNLLDEMSGAILPAFTPKHRFVDELLLPYAQAMSILQGTSSPWPPPEPLRGARS